MTKIPTIAWRELQSYFVTPIGFIVATLFLVMEGAIFYLLVSYLSRAQTPHGAVMEFFFNGLFWLPMIFIPPVLTMKLLAEEQRSGTFETLMTAPVSDVEVVLGKYFAALGCFVLLWVPTFAYVLILRSYAPAETPPDMGPILGGYLGTFLVGAAFVALGTLASALTRNQIIAAMISFVALLLLWLMGFADRIVDQGWQRELVEHMQLFRLMEDFAKGIVDSRRIVYPLSITVFALYATTRVLESRRWR
jgi:ABC-2 type transport system permease protein